MQFDSWADFWNMGGYGFYVWLSFGVAFGSLILTALFGVLSKRKLIAQLGEERARKARIAASKVNSRQDES